MLTRSRFKIFTNPVSGSRKYHCRAITPSSQPDPAPPLLQSSVHQDGQSEQLIGEEVAAGTELTWYKIKQKVHKQPYIHTLHILYMYILTSYAYFRFAFKHMYSTNNRESLHHKCAICVFIVCDMLMSGCQYCCCQLCSVH